MKCLYLFLAVVSFVTAESPIRVRGGVYITQPEEGFHSTLGVVHGARRCGGPGKVTELRVEGCSGEGNCRIPADGQKRRSEYEFVPSEDIDALGIRLIVIEDGATKHIYERPITDSTVQGGQTYIVNADTTVSEKNKDKKYTIQYILYRVDDNHVETCLEADFEHY